MRKQARGNNDGKAEAKPFPESWETFHGRFRDCFARRETWEELLVYWRERCGRETRGTEPTNGAAARRRQRFLTDAVWDEKGLQRRFHEAVGAAVGDREGAICFLEVGFPRKGDGAAGTERQPCEETGRRRNSQVGIFAVYVSPRGAVPVAGRLYVPPAWFGPEAQARRERCRFPADLVYRTKAEIIREMAMEIREADILPCRCLLAAGLAESVHDLLTTPALFPPRWRYFLPPPPELVIWVDKKVFLERPTRHRTIWAIKHKFVRIMKKIPEPLPPGEYAQRIGDWFWHKRPEGGRAAGTTAATPFVDLADPGEAAGADGEDGMVGGAARFVDPGGAAGAGAETRSGFEEFTHRRAVVSLGERGVKTTRRLFFRRHKGEKRRFASYISNAVDTPARLASLVRLYDAPEIARQAMGEAVAASGLGRGAVRTYGGWHRHCLAALLASFCRRRKAETVKDKQATGAGGGV